MVLQFKYLTYCKKYAVFVNNKLDKPRAVANTKAQAIDDIFTLLKAKVIK